MALNQQKNTIVFRLLIAAIFSAVLLIEGCSTTQQQQQGNLLGNETNDYNAGDSAAINNAEDENYGGDNYGGNNYGNDVADNYGEQTNNAYDDDYGGDSQLGLNQGNFGNQLALSNDQIEEEVAEVANNVESNFANTSLNPSLASGGNFGASLENQTGTTPALPSGTGTVKYVRRELTATDQPNGGATVRTLEQGDHPLILEEEAEYSRLSNGSYIPTDGISVEGIGRPKSPRSWQ